MKWNMNSGSVATFFYRLAADDQNPPLADSGFIHSILFICFIEMPRNIVPAPVALRRIANACQLHSRFVSCLEESR